MHEKRHRRHFLAPLTLLLPCLLASCGGGDAGNGSNGSNGSNANTSGVPATQISATRSGEATYYGATGEGNCSFDASPGDLMVAAMNQTDYGNSAACGEHVVVTGPKGQVTVRITDRCPECKPGDIDLSLQAFGQIAEREAGRVPIRWRVVPGNVSGPVSYRYKEGSTRWWFGIQLLNHRLPIDSLEIRPAGSAAWVPVQRMEYNYFVHAAPIASGALEVKVTAQGGATLVQTLPEPQSRLVVQGDGQFP